LLALLFAAVIGSEAPKARLTHMVTVLFTHLRFGFLVAVLLCAGCASNTSPRYFGGHGNLVKPKHYVPKEVQRTDPWLPLF